MKALLLIAHGSRRQASNDEVISLANSLMKSMSDEYNIISAGFLELAEPLISDALDDCLNNGATEIIVVPYFLSAGRHVQTDVPKEIEQWQQNHSDCCVHSVPYIGSSTMMQELIINSINESV